MSQGHIRQRGSKWVAVVELPRNPKTGKRRQRWLQADTKRAVQMKRTELIAAINRGDFLEPTDDQLLGVWLQQWLRDREREIAPTTSDLYRQIIELHLDSHLGGRTLQSIRPRDIQDFYRARRAAGLGERTLLFCHSILHMAFSAALGLEIIARDPLRGVTPPRPDPGPQAAWEPATVAHVHARWDTPIGRLTRLALYTALRRGELLGLRWGDIDFEQRRLSVEQALRQRKQGPAEFSRPKTEGSERLVPLRQPAITLLEMIRREQVTRRLQLGPAWRDLDLVFDRGDGMPLNPSSVAHRFRRASDIDGLHTIRFHDLRHTAITEMLRGGLTLNEVARIAGHTILTMTMKYEHLLIEDLQAKMDRMDQLEHEA